MRKGNASTKRPRSGTSGESTPEARLAEVATPTDNMSDRGSQEDDQDQDDARPAGEQVLSLLKGIDQKKLIALLQGGTLDDLLSNHAQGEKKLAKVVQECV